MRRREQAGWDEHAAFMDGLVAEGRVILGGPIGDGTDVLLVVEAADEDDLRAMLAADPWMDRILAVRPDPALDALARPARRLRRVRTAVPSERRRTASGPRRRTRRPRSR